ncbi:MAG: SRPBCC family protein [Gemmatimonadota bacterium]|nr:SRPBCC family protein [Gemmatimonadota bacterium]
MKRVLVGGLGLVLLIVAVVVGIGMSLPVDHVASVRAQYAASPPEVYEIISDHARYPDWRPSVDRIETLPPRNGRTAWQELGSGGPLPMERVESDPPRRMVTRILSEALPFGGSWTYELAPAGAGTQLTITETGEVYSPVFRFVSRFIMGHHGTATTYLEDLDRRLGEDVTVEVVR